MSNKKIHIVITGGSGQLGQALQEESKTFNQYTYTFLSSQDLDITNLSIVNQRLLEIKPDIIINAAAYTFVDQAEDDPETAYAVNSAGVRNIAQYCATENCALIHISTDYVFDGTSSLSYTEEDATSPQTVYGKSKKAGEDAIIELAPSKYVIIRTSWLYSRYGSNFVKTMLKLSLKRKRISVVDDQTGSPTSANDLAVACLSISSKLTEGNSGIFHYANKGSISWYAFAKAIFDYSNKELRLEAVPSSKFPTKANRPQNSTLDASKIISVFDVVVPFWDISLKKVLTTLKR